jgi:hypothetical protein
VHGQPGIENTLTLLLLLLLLLLLHLQARIEELLDDKADLEYEIDVVERKVELLREEVKTQAGSFVCCAAQKKSVVYLCKQIMRCKHTCSAPRILGCCELFMQSPCLFCPMLHSS